MQYVWYISGRRSSTFRRSWLNIAADKHIRISKESSLLEDERLTIIFCCQLFDTKCYNWSVINPQNRRRLKTLETMGHNMWEYQWQHNDPTRLFFLLWTLGAEKHGLENCTVISSWISDRHCGISITIDAGEYFCSTFLLCHLTIW